MGENIQRLKSCIADSRSKIELAEDRCRKAKKVLKIKERRSELLMENVSSMRRKLALAKEKLQKTYELLDEKHQQLEEVDEVLHTNADICKELKNNETQNLQQSLEMEIALNKVRAKAMEFENKTKELKTRAQVYAREIQSSNIAELKAKRKSADLTSKIVTRKGLIERLQLKEEQFHKRESDFIDKHRFLDKKIKEATTRAETAEKRTNLLQNKTLELRQELHRQSKKTGKVFVLKNEFEHLSLEH